MTKIKKIVFAIMESLLRFCPQDKNKVFFWAVGRYHDNPKYISMKLHELSPSTEIFWEIDKNRLTDDIPDYIKIVYPQTFKYCYIKNRCKILVDAGAGYRIFNERNKFILWLKVLIGYNWKQFDLSTWHGNPIKTIGADIPEHDFWSTKNVVTTSNVLLSDSDYIKELMERAYLKLMPILNVGTPRTDILFDADQERKNDLKKKLGLPLDKKVILYAPTWRESIEDSGVRQIDQIDFEKLMFSLKQKFGGEWLFVMRVHDHVFREIMANKMKRSWLDCLVDGNKHVDMMEYLYVSDVLLTDYSGSIYDVALTDKPCFLFAHDRIQYERNRGFYNPLTFFPYSFSGSFEELLNNINSYDKANAEKLRKEFLKRVGNKNDGHASERVTQYILEKIK